MGTRIYFILYLTIMKYVILFSISILSIFHSYAQVGVKDEGLRRILNKIDSFYKKENSSESYPLGRFREEDYKRKYDFRKSIAADINAIAKDKLDDNDRISVELLEFTNNDELAQYEFKAHLNPLLSDDGFHIDFVSQSNTIIRNTKDAENYFARLKDFPRYVDENFTLIREGLRLGICQPAVVVQGFKSSYQNHIVDTVEHSMFYKPFLQKPMSINEKEWAAIQKQGAELIRTIVVPQYKRIKTFFEEEYVAKTRKTLGATAMPNGKAYYQQRIDFFTTTSMSFEEVYQTGLREVARIEAEMQQVMNEVGFKGTLKEFIEMLRTDPRFYVTTPEALLKEASYIAKQIDWTLPRFFGKLPRQPYGVQPVPAFLAPGYTGGRYSPARGNRAGEYWVNTYNLKSRPLYVLESLTLHEAVPGHHLQMALNAEMEGVPAFRRSLYLSAFGEGWALYCEYLGTEMGFFKDPYSRFGKLTYEMWRACRLVIDVGIHAKGWTQQQAVDYLADHTALSMHEVNTEIVRYISWPGQAVSYKIGELKIREIRKKMEERLKDKFDIRAFHDLILSKGTVTLGILERLAN